MATNSITTLSGRGEVEITYQESLTASLSKRTINAIIKRIRQRNPYKWYWDYRDEVSDDTIVKAFENNPEYPIDYIYETLNDDIQYELEKDAITTAFEKNKKLIIKDILDADKDLISGNINFDMTEVVRDLREYFMDYIETDLDIKSLIRGNIPVRVEMYSNYDCINSFWLESQSPFNMESYFGDVVRFLKFNPAEMKEWLISKGLETWGPWPKLSSRKQMVSYEDFWTELTNMSCGANLLTFPGLVNKYELLNKGRNNIEVTIPKDSNFGFYSSFQGGGSILEMKACREIKIITDKAYDKSGYLSFSLNIDADNGDHSIKRVYGVSDSAFNEISIRKLKSKTIKSKSNV